MDDNTERSVLRSQSQDSTSASTNDDFLVLVKIDQDTRGWLSTNPGVDLHHSGTPLRIYHNTFALRLNTGMTKVEVLGAAESLMKKRGLALLVRDVAIQWTDQGMARLSQYGDSDTRAALALLRQRGGIDCLLVWVDETRVTQRFPQFVH